MKSILAKNMADTYQAGERGPYRSHRPLKVSFGLSLCRVHQDPQAQPSERHWQVEITRVLSGRSGGGISAFASRRKAEDTRDPMWTYLTWWFSQSHHV